MVDEDTKQARLNLLLAQTDQLKAQAAMTRHELGHKEASDRLRVYHFPSVLIPETVDTCFEVLQHWMSLNDNPITVAFNCPGGYVSDGFALYDFIADHVLDGFPIDTTTYGKCASMAGVVMQAGRVRSMHKSGGFMIHEVQSFVQGTTASLKNQLEYVTELQDRVETILLSRVNAGKITQEQMQSRTMHKDWWLTANEALDIGFIDIVV